MGLAYGNTSYALNSACLSAHLEGVDRSPLKAVKYADEVVHFSSLGKRHQFSIFGEVQSLVREFRVSNVIDGSIKKRPYCDAQVEIGGREDMPPVRAPARVC